MNPMRMNYHVHWTTFLSITGCICFKMTWTIGESKFVFLGAFVYKWMSIHMSYINYWFWSSKLRDQDCSRCSMKNLFFFAQFQIEWKNSFWCLRFTKLIETFFSILLCGFSPLKLHCFGAYFEDWISCNFLPFFLRFNTKWLCVY